ARVPDGWGGEAGRLHRSRAPRSGKRLVDCETGKRSMSRSYIASLHEKRAGAHRLDLQREAGQQRVLAHLPPYASSWEDEVRTHGLLKHRSRWVMATRMQR